MMNTTAKLVGGLILLLLGLAPLGARAQEVREPVSHTHVISGDPILLLAGWFTAEYEHKMAETVTVGIAGGWMELDENDYASVSGFLRYYPQEAAFTGFYLGGRAGIHNVDEGHTPDVGNESHTAFGIGVDVGYTWLLGPGGSFYVGVGIGVSRLFSDDLGDAASVIPAVRLFNVGVAF